MATLTCDICNGTLVVSSSGTVVCEACGTPHTKQRLKEKSKESSTIATRKTIPSAEQMPSQTTQNSMSASTKAQITRAKNASHNLNYSEAVSITKNVLATDSTCGDAWMIGAVALFRQHQDNPSTHVLLRVMREMLCAYRYVDTDEDGHPSDLVESLMGFHLRSLVSAESNRYEQKRITSSVYITFIQELAEIQDLYDVIYLHRSNLERSAFSRQLCSSLSPHARVHIDTFTSDYQAAPFVKGMSECIRVAKAIIHFCGAIGDPRYVHYTLQGYCDYLTNDLWSPTPAMRSLGATISNLAEEYQKWEEHHDSIFDALFDERVAFWKEHRKQWCALHIERNHLQDLLSAQPTSTSPKIQQAINRQMQQFTAIIDIKDPAGMKDRRSLLASIETITLHNPDWCAQFTKISEAIAELEATITANWWFFGSAAQIRKEAQQKRDELLALL